MFSALFSFLGGAAFRMIWGEVSAWLNKRQDHKYEIERLRLEGEMDDKRHQREQDRIRLTAELGIKEIRVAGDVALEKAEADAFTEAVKGLYKSTGVKWIDAWNGSIRPTLASVAIALWMLALYKAGWIPNDWDRELMAGILGLYIADRTLAKRGK
jgi:hypothetical protein